MATGSSTHRLLGRTGLVGNPGRWAGAGSRQSAVAVPKAGWDPRWFGGAEKGGGPVSEYPTVICEVVAP
jgi:hypothetical protein